MSGCTRAHQTSMCPPVLPAPITEAAAFMNVFTVLLLLAMAATLGVLMVGLAGFFRGGEFNRKYGNQLMRARVALQAVALLMLLIVLITAS